MSDRKQATVQVAEVTTKAVGAESKTMWSLKDGNGTVYTTFVPGIGNAALQYEGMAALIEWTEKENHKDGRVYTNRYLETVQPAQQPKRGEPEYQEEEVDWDNKERRNFRSRAWAQAISAFPSKEGETPRDYFTRVKPMAQAIFMDVCGDFAEAPPAAAVGVSGSGLSHNDDGIPFAPTVA